MSRSSNVIMRWLFIYFRTMLRPRTRSMIRSLGACLALVLLLGACASGPRYGAAKKQKKGCDCPHWNAVKPAGAEEHASVPRHAAFD